MDYKKEKEMIIESAKKSLVELRKVAEQIIDLAELDPEKARTAAAAKKLAVQDAFEILNLIQIQEGELEEKEDKKESDDFFGVESKIK